MEQHHGSGEQVDRQLNGLLADLARRLSETQQDQIVVQCDDLGTFGPGCADAMCDAGLLTPWEPASATICEGCEQGCIMPVHYPARQDGRPDRALVVCDKRSDIGRIIVDPDRLRQWRISVEGIAAVVAKLLGTDRTPIRSAPDRNWQLGCFRFRGKPVEAFLAPLPSDIAFSGVIVTLTEPGANGQALAISLSRLISFENCRLRLNQTVVSDAIRHAFNNARIACEIIFERGDIVLINHVTGVRREIASPNFNSSNDNAFDALYRNPGRVFTIEDLRAEAKDPTIADLHKLVENLKFDGLLRRLFFRVSKNAVRFERLVTAGQLASLGIDPKTIA